MKRLTLRLPDELHDNLAQLSEREKRSLNNLILYILDLYVHENPSDDSQIDSHDTKKRPEA